MDQKDSDKTIAKKKLEEITNRLFEYMEENKIRKSEMANGMGIGLQHFRNIANHKSGITTTHLSKMVVAFPDLNVYWLLNEEGPKSRGDIKDELDKEVQRLEIEVAILTKVLKEIGQDKKQ